MKTFATNQNNDLYLDASGNLVIIEGLEALMQTINERVTTMLGELVLQTDRGMPNFDTIWNGSPNIPQYNSVLQNAILSVDGVTDVVSITNIFRDNILYYRAVIQTIYGTGALINGVTV